MLCIHMLYHIQIPAHIDNIDMLTFLPSLSQEKLTVSEILLVNYPLSNKRRDLFFFFLKG